MVLGHRPLLRLMLGAGALLLTACGAAPVTPMPALDGAPVVMTVVVDALQDKASQTAPQTLFDGINDPLTKRGLKSTAGAMPGDVLKAIRDTDRRRAWLEKNQTGVVALVELQVEFFSYLNGQNRWTVHATLSVGEAGAAPLKRSLSLPVIMYAYQQQDAALLQAAPSISDSLGRLMDDYFAGRSLAAVTPPGAVYFVLVDRFNNGDKANDHNAAIDDSNAWHGGDFKGIIAKLDHLKSLGVETLWLSPIFKSRAEPWMGHSAFHGYWVEDLSRVDARFVSPGADLKALRTAANSKGMKVVLDMVVNHVAYDASLTKERPGYFHAAQTIQDWNDPHQLETHQVHGLPDLAQERPAVAAFLGEMSLKWAAQSDGFRLDAVKHVPLVFWAAFNARAAAGRPDFMRLGELFDGDPVAVEHTRRAGGFTHMFDFPLSFALRDVFCERKPVGRIGSVLSADRLYDNPARQLVTFVDNHDLPRIRTVCDGDIERVKNALTAQYAMRGVVALNYGTEAGLEGVKEPENRGDMVFSGPAFEALTAHIKSLHALRTAHPVLANGTTRVTQFDGDSLTLERRLDQHSAQVLINTGAARKMRLDSGWRQVLPASGEAIATGGVGIAVGPSRPAPDAESVQVSITATAQLNAGDTLRLVGNLPELGAWQPAKAIPLNPLKEGHFQGSVTLPSDLILACKLVIVDAAGVARWTAQPDHYALSRAGLTLELAFDS